jgi:hypothetical protein
MQAREGKRRGIHLVLVVVEADPVDIRGISDIV